MPKSLSLAEQLMGHALAPDELPVPEPLKESWQPREVSKRIVLWDGGVIAIKIPKDAELIEAEDLGITYLRFSRPARGGHVNVFVHGNDPSRFRGTRIIARPEVWKKIYTDGQAYLYIDIHPLDEGEVNSRLVVVAEEALDNLKGFIEPSIFRTPEPLEGVIVIGYAD